jgi:hypothetical protein
MAASVRIEDEAFSDLRYAILAKACQLADADHAIGKCARIWRQCTQQQKHVLSESFIVAVLGENGVQGLIDAQLAERVEGGLRIRGTEGRIEWLANLRRNASKGGSARAARRQASGTHLAAAQSARRQHVGIQNRANSQPSSSPPAPAPAPAPTLKTPHTPLKGVGGGEASPPENSRVDLFDEFWRAYPRHEEGPDAARRAFERISPSSEVLDTMLKAIAAQQRSNQWKREHGRYIPSASKWLSGGCWKLLGPQPETKQSPEQRHRQAVEFAKGLPPDARQAYIDLFKMPERV